MLLLIAFAALAGAGTALSPCVLPVLPALLSAGASGGRRRPLGIIAGLTATFTITVVGLAEVVHGVGLGDGTLRVLAVVVLAGFGLVLLVPALAARVEAPLSRLARLGPRSRGDGLRSGLLVGAALGFVYAPCAGPILAAVISVGAASGRTVAVGLAYAAGSAVVLLGFTLGGRAVIDRLRAAGRGPAVQRALGLVMLLTALAVVTNADVRFQTALATHFPSVVVNPTGSLERSATVQRRLAALRGAERFGAAAHAAPRRTTPHTAARLPTLGDAPDFTGNQRWFNTPRGAPLTLAGLRGRVVLIDFWTYTCINCLRTLPELKALDARYRGQGLTIVGVHTPEFAFERDAGNVADAIAQNGLRYPVAQDNAYKTWDAWGNSSWPASYLIDARGHVRYTHVGEGDAEQTEAAIRALLQEKGDARLGAAARLPAGALPDSRDTRETYVGSSRAEGWVAPRPSPRTTSYPPAGGVPHDSFALRGQWAVTPESAKAGAGAGIDANVMARHVYLVMSSDGDQPRTVRVLLDGRPVTAPAAGADVRDGRLTVRRQRLYSLVDLPATSQHRLGLRLPPGVSAFAFPFG